LATTSSEASAPPSASSLSAIARGPVRNERDAGRQA
jgi:hypothetical protein